MSDAFVKSVEFVVVEKTERQASPGGVSIYHLEIEITKTREAPELPPNVAEVSQENTYLHVTEAEFKNVKLGDVFVLQLKRAAR